MKRVRKLQQMEVERRVAQLALPRSITSSSSECCEISTLLFR